MRFFLCLYSLPARIYVLTTENCSAICRWHRTHILRWLAPLEYKMFGSESVDYTCLPRRRLGTAKNRNTELDHIFSYLGFDIVYVLLDLLFILTLTDQNDILVLYNDIVFQAL